MWNASGKARQRCGVGSGRLAAQRNHSFGTPIGSVDHTTEKVECRLAEERLLWESIPDVPNLQFAWLIFFQSANSKGNNFIRTLPPTSAEGYAHAHDEGTARKILADLPGSEAKRDRARLLASLPSDDHERRIGHRGLTRCP